MHIHQVVKVHLGAIYTEKCERESIFLSLMFVAAQCEH